MRANISPCREFDSLQISICYKNFQFSLVLSIMNEVYEILKLIINYQQSNLTILENK